MENARLRSTLTEIANWPMEGSSADLVLAMRKCAAAALERAWYRRATDE
jgi:hypothetical protein